MTAEPPADAALRRDIRACLMPGFEGFTAPAWLLRALSEDETHGGMVSLCVYGGNVRDRAQLQALGAELRRAAPAALIAIDEEGGDVTRLHYREGSPYPGAAVLGRIDDPAYTEQVGARVGHDILAAGFNLALAPVADVNSNPRNPVIGTRSFGANPELAARHVAAWTRGLQTAGATACVKHFPGHGDTAQDSHLALPLVDVRHSTLTARDLPPFRAAIAAGARTVMTSHILLPQLDASGPATFSTTILRGLLRDELGFDGVIVSDALDMRGASGEIGIPEAAVRALMAGCELLCLGTDTTPELLREIEDHILTATAQGRLDRAIVSHAAARVRSLAAQTAPAAPPAAISDTPAVPRDELVRIAASFAGLATATEWLRAHPRAGVIRVDSEANMAVGRAPWGPFAAASQPPEYLRAAATAFTRRHSITVDTGSRTAWPAAEFRETGTLVIGRDLHRHDSSRNGIDALRAAGVPALTIELGWPGEEPEYADLACYGSSALLGAALLMLLEKDSL